MVAVLFDLDGVLYEGDKPIDKAGEAVAWFQKRGIPYLFLTNTTSRPRTALVEKLAGFGIQADVTRILTPPVAAVQWLKKNVSGKIALFVPEATQAEFAELPIATEQQEKNVAAVVVGDLGKKWDFDTLNHAFKLLMSDPKPHLIALGMTCYWQAADGLRLDVAPFVVALEHASGASALVMGKPAAPFYQVALEKVGQDAANTIMVGDDIRGDIQAAQKLKLRAVLVRTGKFRPSDLDMGIAPDGIIDSVADLPSWWEENVGLE